MLAIFLRAVLMSRVRWQVHVPVRWLAGAQQIRRQNSTTSQAFKRIHCR